MKASLKSSDREDAMDVAGCFILWVTSAFIHFAKDDDHCLLQATTAEGYSLVAGK